jgi:hypothetical protein
MAKANDAPMAGGANQPTRCDAIAAAMHPSYFGEASPLHPPNHLERSSPTWHVQPDIIAGLSHTTGLSSSLLSNSPYHRDIHFENAGVEHQQHPQTPLTTITIYHQPLPSSLSLPPSRPYSHPGPERLVRDPRLSAQGNPLGSALILPSNLVKNLISLSPQNPPH